MTQKKRESTIKLKILRRILRTQHSSSPGTQLINSGQMHLSSQRKRADNPYGNRILVVRFQSKMKVVQKCKLTTILEVYRQLPQMILDTRVDLSSGQAGTHCTENLDYFPSKPDISLNH